jgi:hypothetical protein
MLFDQHFGFALPAEAVGAPVSMGFLKITLGNINIGGTWLPMGFTTTVSVTFISVSLEVTLLTCLVPLER